uniref:Uncharacterized protein n=1 Tax=Phlebotomus papatasi TaxID=29031 RepID=A0A1B0D0V9_PHLPP
MGDPPSKEYQTYTMHDQQPVAENYKNHLQYGRFEEEQGVQETNIDQDQNGYAEQAPTYADPSYQYQQQGYQPGYQEQGGVYQQQQQQQPQQRHLPQQPVANPFRQAEQAPQEPQASGRPVNPFRQGF